MRKGGGVGSTVRDLRSLYPSPNIVRAIKSIRLRWAGNIARIEKGRIALNILTVTAYRKGIFRKA